MKNCDKLDDSWKRKMRRNQMEKKKESDSYTLLVLMASEQSRDEIAIWDLNFNYIFFMFNMLLLVNLNV